MTRKEEIERIARDYENKIIENNPSAESYDYMNAVIYGAECADKTMIDKAIKFFQSKSKRGMIEENINVFINEFCKTMKEE